MKVDPKNNTGVPPEVEGAQQSNDSSRRITQFTGDSLERFQDVASFYDQILAGGSTVEANESEPKQMMPSNYQILEEPTYSVKESNQRGAGEVQARTAGGNEGAGETPPAQDKNKTGSGSGNQIAGDKESVNWGYEEQYGRKFKETSFTAKEMKDVNGIIDWNKGYELLDGDWQLWKLFEFTWDKGTEKAGEVIVQSHIDLVSLRGRVFGDAGLDWKELTAKLGIGAQVAFELIGGHLEIKHNAPDVKLAGHDASLHSIIKADAFIGAVAEGGAMLSLSGKDFLEQSFLRIGGQAFAGASASISGSTSLGNMASLRGSAQAHAGAGAKGVMEIGFENGELDVDMGAGAALGFGAGYDWGFSVNFVEVGKTLNDAGTNLTKDPLNYPGEFLREIGSVLGTNLGVILHGADAIFSISGGANSDVPSGEPTAEDPMQRIRDKQSGNTPEKPLA